MFEICLKQFEFYVLNIEVLLGWLSINHDRIMSCIFFNKTIFLLSMTSFTGERVESWHKTINKVVMEQKVGAELAESRPVPIRAPPIAKLRFLLSS